jgi:hypothetical protein
MDPKGERLAPNFLTHFHDSISLFEAAVLSTASRLRPPPGDNWTPQRNVMGYTSNPPGQIISY